MPKALLRYVAAKLELLPDPMQESCDCVDATSLVLVLSVTTVITRREWFTQPHFLFLSFSCSTAALESSLQGGLSVCFSVLLISGAAEKAQHLSGWQLKCLLPQRTFPSAIEISFAAGLSFFSMGTPYSGLPLKLARCWISCMARMLEMSKAKSLPDPEAGASSVLNFGWQCVVMCSIAFQRLRQLLLGFGVIPHWPLNNYLSLWMAQLWGRLKVLIAKLQ